VIHFNSLPVLDDGIHFGAVSRVGARVERRKTSLRVPPVSARGPRKFRSERVVEIVQRPGQNHDVVHVQRKANQRCPVTDS